VGLDSCLQEMKLAKTTNKGKKTDFEKLRISNFKNVKFFERERIV